MLKAKAEARAPRAPSLRGFFARAALALSVLLALLLSGAPLTAAALLAPANSAAVAAPSEVEEVVEEHEAAPAPKRHARATLIPIPEQRARLVARPRVDRSARPRAPLAATAHVPSQLKTRLRVLC
ncbi:MAG: hypothetical protein U0271_24885 [Polyangiaceae bacterium]